MNTYRIDLKIAGTGYITARDEFEASRLLTEAFGDGEVTDNIGALIGVEGVSLSPAFTFYGPYPGAELEEIHNG